MRDFWEETPEKKLNKKKIIICISIIVLIILLITLAIIYIKNTEARKWIDKNILQKEKIQNNLPSIEIEESEQYNTIEKLKQALEQLAIPYDKSNYFVKKAEIELQHISNSYKSLENS